MSSRLKLLLFSAISILPVEALAHGAKQTPLHSLSEAVFQLPPFHILTIHFPIAFLVLAALANLGLALNLLEEKSEHLFNVALLLGALSALAAMGTGLWLESHIDFPNELVRKTVEWHERFGIATAIVASLAAGFNLLHRFQVWSGGKQVARWLSWLALALIIVAGHLGASIMHTT